MIGVLGLAHAAWALPVYDTAVGPGNYTGSRTFGNGLTGTGAWGPPPPTVSVAWSIVQNGGSFTYTYTVNFDPSDPTSARVSHAIIDLSDDCVTPGDPQCMTGVTVNGAAATPALGAYSSSIGNSNPGLPATIVGVKVDNAANAPFPWVLSFTSNRAPVWGDFYAKDGNAGGLGVNAVWNIGNSDHSSTNTLHFIARPDGESVPPTSVPEPASLVLMGTGLIGVGALIRRRSRRARAS